MSRRAAGVFLTAVLLTACGRTDQRRINAMAGTAGSPSSSGGGGGMAPGGSGGSGASGGIGVSGSGGGPRLDCDEAVPSVAPLSRLVGREITRTWEHALGVPVDHELAGETGELAQSALEPVSLALMTQLHNVAHDAAQRFGRDQARLAALSGCEMDADTDDVACRDRFIERFLRLAFRRPATEDDVAEMTEVFATGVSIGGDFAAGARAVAEVALHSPELMYLMDADEPLADEAVAIGPHELAARLSYFLTGGPPDEALRKRSEAPSWSAEVLAAEARRLVGKAASREQVQEVYAARYHLAQGPLPSGVAAEVWRGAREQANAFIEHVTFEGDGTFRELLLGEDPFSSARRRPGLFTQQAFLLSTSRSTVNPVQRGVVVAEQLLCSVIPRPPEGVTKVLPPSSEATTLRERLLAGMSPPCLGCHQLIDPLGFAFENYDSAGEWRDEDNGEPIDASGELRVSDVPGPFDGAEELMASIAESEDAKRCFVDQWLEQAYRRPLTPADDCARQRLLDAFLANDGSVPDLLVDIARDEHFRYRAAAP